MTFVILAVVVAFTVPFMTHTLPFFDASISLSNSVHKSTSESGNPSPSPHSRETIVFQTIEKGFMGGYAHPTNFVINDNRTWSAVWAVMQADCVEYCPPVPAVDFNTRTVLAVFLGEYHTCCEHDITIVQVVQIGSTVTVHITVTQPEARPGRICFAYQIFSYPFHIVDIPKTVTDVKFVADTTNLMCG